MVGLKKILVIKLAAIGDVLRTTALLRGLKRKYPHSHISWLTRRESLGILKGNHLIDCLFAYEPLALKKLIAQRFDVLICLDKEKEATSLAVNLEAKNRIGFGLDPKTRELTPLNKESIYAYRLGICDELKFKKNKKTYPQIIFEMAGLTYQNDEYILNIAGKDRLYAKNLLYRLGLKSKDTIIGLNTGAGPRFANKAWTEDGFLELINLIQAWGRAKILLLGGPDEKERNLRILKKTRLPLYDSGCNNTLTRFCGIVDCCSLVVSGDTTALHIAIACKKPVVAIFGSTCSQEIELYGRGIKITSNISCRPCYKKECHKKENCMSLIKPARIFRAVQKLLPKL